MTLLGVKDWPIIVRVLCLELVLSCNEMAHAWTEKGGTAVSWWLLGVAGVEVRLSLPRLKHCFTSRVPSVGHGITISQTADLDTSLGII